MKMFFIVLFSFYGFVAVAATLDFLRLWPLNDRFRFRKDKHD